MMQGESEPSVNFLVNNTSKQISQHHHQSTSVLSDRTIQRPKFSNKLKKPFWLTRRQSKIKLPTQFLLGGTISDPLNLQGLQKESGRQSDIWSFDIDSQVLSAKRSHRIGIPNISDASDPLNLKNVPSEEQESLSNDCVTSAEKQKIAGSESHCQVLHTLPLDASEASSERRCLEDTKEKMSCCTNSLTLSEIRQHCVEVTDCKTDDVPVEAALKITNNTLGEHMPSVFNEVEAVACDSFTSHGKVVSPVIPQFSRHRARKRQQRSACKETVQAAGSSHKSSYKKSREKFPCGNYVAYYGYRNVDKVEDPRLELLPKELFDGKDILDVGCNAGMVTIAIASTYSPEMILGIDVDQRLIGLAKRNVRRYMDENSYPSCLKTAFGPIAASLLPSTERTAFPHNILFQVGDYVPDSDANLCRQCDEYDVILALSVTKWIHLTHGDAGLKRSFRRMFLQLRPGGKLVLEAQPWASYKRKKKLTEKIYEVYRSICFKPEQFNDYLLSADVGFSSCELLGTPEHKSKGFQRSIYLFTKPCATAVTSST